MSDDIEIPEVDTDDIIETSDEEGSVASSIAFAAAGVATGIGIWIVGQKLSEKVEGAIVRHWIKTRSEDPNNSNQEE